MECLGGRESITTLPVFAENDENPQGFPTGSYFDRTGATVWGSSGAGRYFVPPKYKHRESACRMFCR